jgi:hypothetical protein
MHMKLYKLDDAAGGVVKNETSFSVSQKSAGFEFTMHSL